MRSSLAALRLIVTSLLLAACAVPASAPQPRTAIPVAAPFAKTWNATVDAFADKNIGIRTIDRSSGLIVGEPVRVDPGSSREASPLADCGGKSIMGQRSYNRPVRGVYNVRVRGDSTASTVQVTVRWIGMLGVSKDTTDECASSGAWETAIERSIKQRAETQAR